MESLIEDENDMDQGLADSIKQKKRQHDDADKDEGPTTGLDRGLKRHRTRKGTETSRKTSTSKDSSKGKSLTTSSKSVKSAKNRTKFDNTDMPMDQGEDLGKTNEQPKDEAIPNNDWYKKSISDTSPDPEWNEGN
ncbi:hypothetical protein Tco_0166140 [Tanacetum coccineum]